jgi:regulator of protease activity HflC (stomatin/prohibitin superfamily)
MVKRVKIRTYQRGLYFRDREFKRVLQPGTHWFFDPFLKVRVDVVSMRNPWLAHPDLDVIVRSGALGDEAVVADLKDHQRALVWIDGRFARILAPGLHVLWTKFRAVEVQVLDARGARFAHPELGVIQKSGGAAEALDRFQVEEGHVGLFYKDGEFVESLGPGRYAFWKNAAKVRLYHVDLREVVLDVAGQEIMTADKVTLRLNAVVVYRVTDARKSVTVTEDVRQALYREAQLALRAVIGTRELDALLADKDAVAKALEAALRRRAAVFGLEVISLGIRDVVLPGDMKELMNKVTEARRAAEANLIARREETAAMRSQANTAKVLEANPTLMRLRELEALEKVAGNSELKVVLGEKGLADRVVNLL